MATQYCCVQEAFRMLENRMKKGRKVRDIQIRMLAP